MVTLEPCYRCGKLRPEESSYWVDIQQHGIWARVAKPLCESCWQRIEDDRLAAAGGIGEERDEDG